VIGPEDVLAFWFGDLKVGESVPNEVRMRWFKKDPAFDAAIEERFGAARDGAARGELDGWIETPRGILALIIVLDQFTRNTRRDTPAMYANDAQALELTRLFLDTDGADALHPDMQTFGVMPLMHSEDPLDQERCVAWGEALAERHPGEYDQFVKYAKIHRDIVVKYGRFPHRNSILGRESTPEELEFLKTPGSSF